MEAENTTCRSISDFTLSGIPDLDDLNFWLGFPLVLMYVMAVLGNLTIIYIIKVHQALHSPMYVFLLMLSIVELLIATTTMPKMLGIFWFDSRRITFDMCLTQMFSIHFLSTMESGILTAMAFDRYVAISHPLKYSSFFTNQTIIKITFFIMVRGIAGVMPLPLLVKRFPLWRSNLLTHSYCLHQEVMKLACADITVNVIIGLVIVFTVMCNDSLFILFSYLLIIKTVACLADESNLKAINTCTAHLCAVLIYYIPVINASVAHRFQYGSIPHLPVLFGNVYLLLPPMINPLIYGIKTKQIYKRLIKLFLNRRCKVNIAGLWTTKKM
ncbi:olfactory receptor 51E1-like [Hyperolius riggenbachi]|uniref:olfactory receptor 51E1-like n=1 Tax=Hyperolius riggenbachi TaxID=752182 RepID=UPI0035A2B12C